MTCTEDVCNPAVGMCALAKDCDDGNACTNDYDPVTGECKHEERVCDVKIMYDGHLWPDVGCVYSTGL